jgi:hypothetical protein
MEPPHHVPLPTTHAGIVRADSLDPAFGLLPEQAQLLAPLLMLSPQPLQPATARVPAKAQHDVAQPRRPRRRVAPQRFVDEQPRTAAPAIQQPFDSVRQTAPKAARKGQAAVKQEVKPPASREPAAGKRSFPKAPTTAAVQHGSQRATGTAPAQSAAQAAGGRAGAPVQPRRRAGRKSAVPRQADAAGHRVSSLPEGATHAEPPAGKRAVAPPFAAAGRKAAKKGPTRDGGVPAAVTDPAVQAKQPVKDAASLKKVGVTCAGLP